MTKEERKEYDRQYYLKHHGKIIEKRKQYYENNKEKVIKRISQYRQDHRNTDFYCDMLEQHCRYKTEIRHKALDLYGGKCENCGSVDHLEFHHLNLDGEEERKIYSSTKMCKSLADGNKRSDLRLLCRSCHHKIHNDLRSNI